MLRKFVAAQRSFSEPSRQPSIPDEDTDTSQSDLFGRNPDDDSYDATAELSLNDEVNLDISEPAGSNQHFDLKYESDEDPIDSSELQQQHLLPEHDQADQNQHQHHRVHQQQPFPVDNIWAPDIHFKSHQSRMDKKSTQLSFCPQEMQSVVAEAFVPPFKNLDAALSSNDSSATEEALIAIGDMFTTIFRVPNKGGKKATIKHAKAIKRNASGVVAKDDDMSDADDDLDVSINDQDFDYMHDKQHIVDDDSLKRFEDIDDPDSEDEDDVQRFLDELQEVAVAESDEAIQFRRRMKQSDKQQSKAEYEAPVQDVMVDEQTRVMMQQLQARKSRFRRASQHLRNGHLRKAIDSLLVTERPKLDDSTISDIRKLFPRDNPSWQQTTPPPSFIPMMFSEDEVTDGIKQLARGQSYSVTGAAPDQLKVFINNKTCMKAITSLVNKIANGNLADNIRSFLLRSRLIILLKTNGGFRPISIPEPFLMLAEHLCLCRCKHHLPALLEPMQLGVGAKAGVEQAKHRMQHVIDSGSRDRQTVVMLIDITNAYGTISRKAMLDALYANRDLFPLWQIAYWSMSAPSVKYLRMDDGSIQFLWQEEGGAQGSVIMPALFAVALQPLLNDAQSIAPNTEIAAILDDIAVGGDLHDVLKAYDLLSNQIKEKLGASVNPRKSIMILGFEGIPTEEIVAACASRNITLQPDGDRYVGSFIGRNRAMQERFVLDQLKKHEQMFETLGDKGIHAQSAMILLRVCMLPCICYEQCAPR